MNAVLANNILLVTLPSDQLLAGPVVSGTPSVNEAAISQTHGLVARDLAVTPLIAPLATITEVNHFGPLNITTSVPEIRTAIIGQTQRVLAVALTAAPKIQNTGIAQTHGLIAKEPIFVPVIDGPTIVQEHELESANTATAAPTINDSVIRQSHVLVTRETVTAGPTIQVPTISQLHRFTSTGIITGGPDVDAEVSLLLDIGLIIGQVGITAQIFCDVIHIRPK